MWDFFPIIPQKYYASVFGGHGKFTFRFSVCSHFVAKKKKKKRRRKSSTGKCDKPIIPIFTLGQETVSNLRVGLSSSSSYTGQIRLPTTRLTKKRRAVKLLEKFDFLSSDHNAILFSILSLNTRKLRSCKQI